MTENKNLYSRITAFLDRNISRDVMDALRDSGLHDFSRIAGRCIIRKEKSGVLSLIPGRDLEEDPLDIVSFLVDAKHGPSMLALVIASGGLEMPGRGSVFCEEVRLLKSHESVAPEELSPSREVAEEIPLLRRKMSGICCIVQSGQGNRVARIALDTGVCVPAINLGFGTGVRDKMGLLRITIPAEKEIITLITNSYDADTVMELMIDLGKLDQPGKGFIFSFPLRQGVPNIRVCRGERQHAASIDQIVAAIDNLRGGSEWRQKSVVLSREGHKKRHYISGLVDLILLCDEGFSMPLIKAAMAAGAGGATVTRFKQSGGGEGAHGKRIGGSREACSIGIPEGNISIVLDALDKAGAFSDECRGQVLVRPIGKAFTYIRKN